MKVEIVRVQGRPPCWSVHVRNRRGKLMLSSGFYRTRRAARRCAELLALPLEGPIRFVGED